MPAFDSIAVNAALTTNLSVASVMSVTGSLGVTGSTTLSNVTVPGAATLGSASVTTLGVSGTSTLGAVTVNGALSGQNGDLNVTGNVVVSGDIIAQGNVIYQGGPAPIQYQNLADRTVMDPAQVFGYTPNKLTNDNTILHGEDYLMVRPIIATSTLNLRTGAGPTSLLTSGTSWNNPVATNYFGAPATLVKTDDTTGAYTYIDVANNSISNICTLMMPTDFRANTFSVLTILKSTDDLIPRPSTTVSGAVSYSNVLDSYANYVGAYVKRGLPLPPSQGCPTYNTRNVYYNHSFLLDDPTDDYDDSNILPISMAIDVNPYLDGFGSMNLYFSGGQTGSSANDDADYCPPQLPGLSYGGIPTMPAFPMPVTTSGAEYQYKVSLGQNVLYLNTDSQVLNISITNFGSYNSTWPFFDSNLFESNVITSTPISFSGSFGLFRTTGKVVTAVSGTDSPDANVSMSVSTGTVPVTASVASAEYMIQCCDTITFAFDLTDGYGVTTAYTSRMKNNYNSEKDYFILAPLDQYASSSNASIIHHTVKAPTIQYGQEYPFIPSMSSSNVGGNYMYPFANIKSGINGFLVENEAYIYEMPVYFNNIPIGSSNIQSNPETLSLLPSAMPTPPTDAFPATIYFHEFWHVVGKSLGFIYGVFHDDELLATAHHTYTNVFGKVPGVYNGLYSPSVGTQVLSHITARGISFCSQTNIDLMANSLVGTNWNKQPNDAGNPNPGDFLPKYSSHTGLLSPIYKYDPNGQMLKLYSFNLAKKYAQMPFSITEAIQRQLTGTKTGNPNFALSAYNDAVRDAHAKYSDGTLITSGAKLFEETIISGILARNNAAIPDKYKCAMPIWWASFYNPAMPSMAVNVNRPFTSGYWRATGQKIANWDYMQTNDDSGTTSTLFDKESVIPWWPKNITGLYSGNKNSVGRVWTNPITGLAQAQTQDTTYRAMSNVALTNYTSNVVRNLYPTGGAIYAMPLTSTNLAGVSNVTVTLTEPTTGGSYAGGYNSNISVCVFKYIPDRCVSNVLSNAVAYPTASNGAFMMAGPYTLSSTGTTTKTIDLNAVVTDGTNGYTFSTTSANLVNGTLAFNHKFSYGIDDGTVYIPPTWANAYATELGMTASSGVYQPVTFLMVMNNAIDPISFTDADIQQKLWASQIKPSAVKISINGTT